MDGSPTTTQPRNSRRRGRFMRWRQDDGIARAGRAPWRAPMKAKKTATKGKRATKAKANGSGEPAPAHAARLHDEFVETIDEELELEIDDDRLADLLGHTTDAHPTETLDRHTYFKELLRLQKELVKLQDWVMHHSLKVVVLFEGRDAAGKGGVI